MNITIIGLGKIGLPLAVQFAGRGHAVHGVDIAPAVVDAVAAGRPPFPGEDQLADRLSRVVSSGALQPSTDTAGAVAASEFVVVVVPLYVDDQGAPDFTALDAATGELARGLRPGTLVSYETTLPVGCTRRRIAPRLRSGSGLEPGVDFSLAFSPERVYSGRVFRDLARYPKLVGGIDEPSGRHAVECYSELLSFDERPDLDRPNGVWDLGSAEAAEFAKLAETTYRDVNIGLVNQFALHAQRIGVDLARVIEACNSQPFSHLHRPGIAVGGHCIPVYPQFYLYGDPHATVVRAARDANSAMPARALELLAQAGNGLAGRRVAVLGAAYRGGVRETTFSGAFDAVASLRAHGAEALVHDPLYTPDELAELGFASYRPGDTVDFAVVQADHDEYRTWSAADLPGVRIVLDGRGVLDPSRWPGVDLLVLGRANSARSAGHAEVGV
ncbi:nucleotide sugar dehydrogenase [Saccharopolyspora mangrovi]|uniref:Nucleotide sugar dehydrogenase n=1 Tax=Saccharopolyspora mangrovi TaxID=3082379 RepID=A0ABU6A4H0_9PSEU|nr:nucleotide sugar dehydrogenase [Saccharopolyspora sp. S2-29]MEB3366461.1 nucleotide sugar dehydrogenase [Saccharopolyspora sp. S2-29]